MLCSIACITLQCKILAKQDSGRAQRPVQPLAISHQPSALSKNSAGPKAGASTCYLLPVVLEVHDRYEGGQGLIESIEIGVGDNLHLNQHDE